MKNSDKDERMNGQKERDLLEQLIDFNFKTALFHKPVYGLRQILSLKSLKDLREIARMNRLAGYTKLKKDALTDALFNLLPDPETIESALRELEWEEWTFFQKAAAETRICDKCVFVNSFLHAQKLGLLQEFIDDDMYFAVPKEIRTVFNAMKKSGVIQSVDRTILMNAYAKAAVNLYGIIPLSEFTKIFNEQNGTSETPETILMVLLQLDSSNNFYCVSGDLLVHTDFREDDFEGIADLKNHIRGKDRYIPEKEEFLLYNDPFYFEETPQTEKLEALILCYLTKDQEQAFDLLSDIVYACMAQLDFNEVLSVFDEHGFQFDSKAQLELFLPALQDLNNHVRIWENKGFTPDELYRKKYPGFQVIEGKAQKVGRNELCPCGSGKKYKKCCGRGEEPENASDDLKKNP